MNRNLSTSQFAGSSMSKDGAMPLNKTFDGDGPLKASSQPGVMPANDNILVPKPGFF